MNRPRLFSSRQLNERQQCVYVVNGRLLLAALLLLCGAFAAPEVAAQELALDFADLIPQSKEFLLRERRELAEMKEGPVTYRVQQKLRLDAIPANSKEVLIWISIPSDDDNQKLLSLLPQSIPGEWGVVADADRRGRFLHSRVSNPEAAELEFTIEFAIRRSAIFTQIDPENVGPLSDLERSLLGEHLDRNALHMEVNEKVQAIADEVCGDETNIAIQTVEIMKHIAKSVDHYSYSKDPLMPRCGVGDAQNCLAQGGGCCTDLNSLFIALARARGIPARLNMGYRLQEQNVAKWADPGYRCWVEYYVPGYGWVSADIVEADAPNGKGHVRWLTGLTPRRIWLNEGRQFKFTGAHAAEPVNHMNIAYAEIDGVAARVLPEGDLKPQLTREVFFEEVE